MILLKQNVDDYNNDIRAMLMAFFPGEKIIDYKTYIANEMLERFTIWVYFDDDRTYLALFENVDFDEKFKNDEKFQEIIENAVLNAFTEKGFHNLDKDFLVNLAMKKVIESGYPNSIVFNGWYKDRDNFRNIFKLKLYRLLSDFAKRKLPWGDLTGVRPTKIAMKKIREGYTREEVIDYYMETYDTSEAKAKLSFKVADKELRLVKDIELKDSYCLYVGIPFCPSRCLYCSFTAYAIALHEDKVDRYIDMLCREITYVAQRYADKKLVALYVGGGTPTSINHIQLDRLLEHIDDTFGLDGSKPLEYTIEAGRPDSITKEKLRVMKKHHVTRISINPQTMNDKTLKTIGRAHTVEDVERAFALARECGFDNINMDLIAGLPGEDILLMEHTLDKISRLNPDSLTVHSLAIKRAARLNEQMDEYKSDINHDINEMLDRVDRTATKLNMEPYYLYRQKNIGGNLENVGYALPHKECLYNILIMEELTDIIAVGAGSSSKYIIRDELGKTIRIDRSENCKSIDDYIERFDEMLSRKR